MKNGYSSKRSIILKLISIITLMFFALTGSGYPVLASSAFATYTLQPAASVTFSNESTLTGDRYTVTVGGTYDFVTYYNDGIVKDSGSNQTGKLNLNRQDRVVLTNVSAKAYELSAPTGKFNPLESIDPAFSRITLQPGQTIEFSNLLAVAGDSFSVSVGGTYDYVEYYSDGTVSTSEQNKTGRLHIARQKTYVLTNSGQTAFEMVGPYEQFKPVLQSQPEPSTPTQPIQPTEPKQPIEPTQPAQPTPSTPQQPTPVNSTQPILIQKSRLAGQSRYETAKIIAESIYSGTVQNVVLVSGKTFPDALAGSVLAYKLKAPILMVDSTLSTSLEASDYITSHLASDGSVYILGGTGIIGPEFKLAFQKKGYKVWQIGGQDQYETSSLIAEEEESSPGTPLVIASGGNFPDALSISSFASNKGWPIMLTGKDILPSDVAHYIIKNQPTKVYITGGVGVISKEVELDIKSLVDNVEIIRLAGKDCYDTGNIISSNFSSNPSNVFLASGTNFPDALAGSIVAAQTGSPIILIDSKSKTLNNATINYLKSLTSKPKITILGGTGVISDGIISLIEKILNGENVNEPSVPVAGDSTPYWVENGERLIVNNKETYSDTKGISHPLISPDGKWLVYSQGKTDLIVMDLQANNSKVLYSESDSDYVVYPMGWSEDNEKILFLTKYKGIFSGGNRLMIVNRTGGDPNLVIEGAMSADWGKDGSIIVATPSEIKIIDQSGRQKQTLTTPKHGWFADPDSPTLPADGKSALYHVGSNYYLHDLVGDKYKTLFTVSDPAGTGKAYMDSNGKVVFVEKEAVHIYDVASGNSIVYYDQADCNYVNWLK